MVGGKNENEYEWEKWNMGVLRAWSTPKCVVYENWYFEEEWKTWMDEIDESKLLKINVSADDKAI